jgi:isopenicillin N synthase-like dioxygenase
VGSSDATVATIDISSWADGTATDRASICAQIDQMGREVGFLSVVGHGLPHELCRAALDVAGQFFDLDVASKVRYTPSDKTVNRGYAGYGEESLAYSLGVEALPDMFEAFNMGVELSGEAGMAHPYFVTEAHRFFAPNVWPTELPHMREVWLRYFAACELLASQLDEICSAALGMEFGHIRQFTRRSPNVMRANNYQRRAEHGDPQEGQVRMGAHTDYGIMTILLADPVPGLQIMGSNRTWHDVVPTPGSLIVNFGDLLAEWTNDRWKSTLHRVVPPPLGTVGEARRRSIAFFHEADYDARIEVMPSCIAPGESARYSPVTAGEHLLAKLMGPRTQKVSTAQQTTTASHDAATIHRRVPG